MKDFPSDFNSPTHEMCIGEEIRLIQYDIIFFIHFYFNSKGFHQLHWFFYKGVLLMNMNIGWTCGSFFNIVRKRLDLKNWIMQLIFFWKRWNVHPMIFLKSPHPQSGAPSLPLKSEVPPLKSKASFQEMVPRKKTPKKWKLSLILVFHSLNNTGKRWKLRNFVNKPVELNSV